MTSSYRNIQTGRTSYAIEGLALELSQACQHLSSSDQDFAGSLLGGWQKYGSFSAKQLPYVERLIQRANNAGRPQAAKAAALDLSQVNAMFDSAKAHGKKKMALRFIDAQKDQFKVSPAGESSANAGMLYVKSRADGYLGKITQDGEFKPAYGVDAAASARAGAALVAFCQDPKGAAVTYGQTTGNCMFCGLLLTDARSVKANYGPICAENYGLAWGDK